MNSTLTESFSNKFYATFGTGVECNADCGERWSCLVPNGPSGHGWMEWLLVAVEFSDTCGWD